MEIGVFIPIGNNGWLRSRPARRNTGPTFELNKQVVQKAEPLRHLDFALSMIKLRGFGGKSEFWDPQSRKSFTLMAGLAAVTERIQLYASVAVLTIPSGHRGPHDVPPSISISGGPLRHQYSLRLGQGRRYETDGALWPGEEALRQALTTTAPSM